MLNTFLDTPEKIAKNSCHLKAAQINTILGDMIAIADETFIYLLEFVNGKKIDREIINLKENGFALVAGDNAPLLSIEKELKAYFEGTLIEFKTPYHVLGSPFQQLVWQALCNIPYGETRSYAQQSQSLGKPKSYRAVANANGANQLAIIIPCHRVIASDGSLGGYGGGLEVKKWLLEHEKNIKEHINEDLYPKLSSCQAALPLS